MTLAGRIATCAGAFTLLTAAVPAVASAASCLGKPATMVRGAGDNTIEGSPGADVIVAGDGDDLLDGGPDRDVLIGDSGTLTGSASGGGDDTLRGGGDGDTMFGDSHANNLGGSESGGGRDLLKAGEGNDSLDGGPSRDQCDDDGGTDIGARCEISTGIP